jgi:hypothetical protein
MKTLTILIVFLMAACGGGSSDSNLAMNSYEEGPMVEVAEESVSSSFQKFSSTGQEKSEIQQKIVKTGNLSYRVEETNAEYDQVLKMLPSFDAYIASKSQNKGYDRVNYNLSIKVPPQNFDSLVNQLMSGKRVDSKWVNSDDVTDQFYDLQSRIDNKKNLEERYQEILTKANSVKDILEVERSLNQVRSEIESMEGQFKLLNHRISYSTLDLSFYEILPYTIDEEQRPGFLARISNALSGGWQGFLSFLVLAVRLWPFIILSLGFLFLIKKIRARRKSS